MQMSAYMYIVKLTSSPGFRNAAESLPPGERSYMKPIVFYLFIFFALFKPIVTVDAFP